MEQCPQSIIVCGLDDYNQLGETPNYSDGDCHSTIYPSKKSTIDPSTLLSFSIYSDRSVLVTKNYSMLGSGDNMSYRISSTLIKDEICQFTEFTINDDNGQPLKPLSAVCVNYATLYMFTKSDKNVLVICNCHINEGTPIFLDIGDANPIALFAGYIFPAAITDKGEVIFINCFPIMSHLTDHRINPISLPDGEKAVHVACSWESVIVLSTKGHVFFAKIKDGCFNLDFYLVEELAEKEIVSISGFSQHFLAVSKEGMVYAYGSNNNGQLGLGQEIMEVSMFTKIQSLEKYEIRAAYAGHSHSLFETYDGKVLSCGNNEGDPLFIDSKPGRKVYLPEETVITNGATFCIAGLNVSAVFIGGQPPINMPNKKVKQSQFK